MKIISLDDLRNLLRAKVTEGASMRAVAKALGVSVTSVSNTIAGKLKPGPKILRALGYRRVEQYQRLK